MAKSSRLLSILNLLTRRQCASLHEIMDVCGVPERTVYRYLDSLSEAGVPIYFDRESKAYRLANPIAVLSKTLTDTDVVVLATSLLLMRPHLNPRYGNLVETIASKVCAFARINTQDIEASITHDRKDDSKAEDYSTNITAAIIFQAVHDRRHLTIARRTDAGEIVSQSIRNASITFERGWHLRGDGHFGAERIEMKTILSVSTNFLRSDRQFHHPV